MTIDTERRTYDVEIRVESAKYGKNSPTIRGYAAKFNTLSNPMAIIRDGQKIGTFREKLIPGCFSAALPVSDIRMLVNHDPNLILGRNTSGTLRISEDAVGLRFENDPPETSYSKDIQVSISRGDVSQCSFAFAVAAGGDDYVKDPDVENGYIRSIREVRLLLDASVVTYPAYDDTNCAVRSIINRMREEEEAAAKAIADKEEAERRHKAYIKRKKLHLLSIGV